MSLKHSVTHFMMSIFCVNSASSAQLIFVSENWRFYKKKGRKKTQIANMAYIEPIRRARIPTVGGWGQRI